jgi:hypothetical protein
MYILYMIFIWTFTCFGGAPCLIVYAPESHTLSNYRVRLVSGKKKKNHWVDWVNFGSQVHSRLTILIKRNVGMCPSWFWSIWVYGFLLFWSPLLCNSWLVQWQSADGGSCSTLRPVLEYASPVFDPHQIATTRDIEQVQRRAARFAYNCYQDNSPGCVTNLLNSLRLSLLSGWCVSSRSGLCWWWLQGLFHYQLHQECVRAMCMTSGGTDVCEYVVC